jgi:hypothetical protein
MSVGIAVEWETFQTIDLILYRNSYNETKAYAVTYYRNEEFYLQGYNAA